MHSQCLCLVSPGLVSSGSPRVVQVHISLTAPVLQRATDRTTWAINHGR